MMHIKCFRGLTNVVNFTIGPVSQQVDHSLQRLVPAASKMLIILKFYRKLDVVDQFVVSGDSLHCFICMALLVAAWPLRAS